MSRHLVADLLGYVAALSLAACGGQPVAPTPAPGLPNPASVFCEQNGGRVVFRTDASGAVAGDCVFPNGSVCDEWAYFRDTCQPAKAVTLAAVTLAVPTSAPTVRPPAPAASATPIAVDDGWKIYRNAPLGYTFRYPGDATIEANADPLKSLSIVGPLKNGERWPMITLSHPADREEYRPPQGVDLAKWLVEHDMLGDRRMPDTRIGGVLAVHTRFDRSPQSYAYDRYYFAREGRLYMLVIGHTGDKEDWTLYNRFLASFAFG
jgi:putative hemolysin